MTARGLLPPGWLSRRGGHAIIALVAVAFATAVPAQERTLRPVVVTPTPGVAQQAFDTPASVDVIDSEALQGAQLGINLSESLMRAPGVTALHRQNYAQDLQVSIRGFGARSTFGVRGLRLYADGIPATAPDGQGQVSHFDLLAADRIEVLRGPFSSLYGNSSGGVISLFTADGPPQPVAEAATAFGSFGVRRHHVRVAGDDGPWNYNLSATHFETGGSREHSAARRGGFNGKLRYRLAPDTRLTLVANAMDMPDVQDPLGLTRAEWEADPRAATPAALQFDTRKSVDQLQAGAILEHRWSAEHAGKLTLWQGRRGTQQVLAIPTGPQMAATHSGGVIDLARAYRGVDAQWVGKSRFAGGPFTLTGGLYADELREDRRGFQNFSGDTLGVMGALRRDEANRVRSFDQYLHAHWTSERFTVTAGLRHSVVRFASTDRYVTAGNGDDSGATRYAATTPAAGVVWHVHERLNVYAALGRGFETPTFNELSYRPGGAPGLNFALQPATSRQWEFGLKAEPADGWRVNAAVFQARTDDEIVVLSNAGGRSTFQNAGRTRRQGAEVALQGRWGAGWSFALAASWLDAAYASDFLTCLAAPCTVPDTRVAAGNRIPGIPRTSAFAELAWRHAPWGLEAAVEWRHTGRIAVDDRNTDFAPAASVWNLRLGFTQRQGRWTLREFVRVDNVAGRRYAGSVIVNEGNRRFFEPAPGRHWLAGVHAGYAF